MRAILWGTCFLLLAATGFAESTDPPLDNKKLTVHTLVREDVFAGWRANDMERFARGEKNIDLLLEQRPASKAELLAWKGGTVLYRAILAKEAGDDAAFQAKFQEAQKLLAEAENLGGQNPAVSAVVGGSYVFFGDRLPEEHRAAAFEKAYDHYQALWEQQGRHVERLPLHIKGELLAGLIQSSQRTGRTEETARHLDKMIEVLPDTSYARMAERWKTNPQAAATSSITCKSCHTEGRLSDRLAKMK
jgi:hypothetical protein